MRKKSVIHDKRQAANREQGRSMVEMLGVLAIIGVLTIGGVAGYTYAMNRHRANEIVDGAIKRAYTIATQITMGIPSNLSEFSEQNDAVGGTFLPEIKNWGGEFGIQINNVTGPVCENLLRMTGTHLHAITKMENERVPLVAGQCADINNLYLVYSLDTMASINAASTRDGSGGSTNSSTGGSGNSSQNGGVNSSTPDEDDDDDENENTTPTEG